MFASISKAANDASNAISKTANNAALGAEKAMYEEQIRSVKAKFGIDSFDAALRGDMDTVQRLAMQANEEVMRLMEKLARLAQRVEALNGSPTQQMTVVVPQGAAPGSTFMAMTPGGTQFSVVVPQAATPGTHIVVEAPRDAAVHVAVGRPI